ncbi:MULTISPECIES: Crp/Fnr family transcriptional regulator [Roseateles]|uniref:Crp/Fnr family transcriptional regulator n=1 Tax=Roseateles albus TaxID=2987525 RepID=A0ABT5K8L8_9BURK|nr:MULTISPECIES: Crp/Fnr family transcriptional regulator [Roseateles]MCV2360662.1 Crp/Fnr family transcriptional regulator [Paucibacter sp. TC2R-5]MDC8770291.1 Crp/Fnr family transcriptional regulator [Roseateles albus]
MDQAEKLQDEMLAAIASRGDARNYPAHAVLINEGDQSDAFFILLAGRVKVYGAGDDGREVIYNTLGPGEYFGELSLLDGAPRSASVASLEPLRCVMVRGADMRKFLAQYPDFAYHLIQRLALLLRRSTDNVKSLALDDVYQRVARMLNELAGAEPPDGGPRLLSLKLTQQDIAERVGSSREMISRIFKQLLQGGYVEQRDGRLVLLKKLPAGW